jgi:hypothetical protein
MWTRPVIYKLSLSNGLNCMVKQNTGGGFSMGGELRQGVGSIFMCTTASAEGCLDPVAVPRVLGTLGQENSHETFMKK